MEGLPPTVGLDFGLILENFSEVVTELLPIGLSPPLTLQSFQWERVTSPLFISFLVGVLFLFRLLQSVRSWLYVRREKQLTKALAARIEKKCHLIDKLYAAKKEYEEIKSSLEKARLERDTLNVPGLADAYRKAVRANAAVMVGLRALAQELKEKPAHSEQQHVMVEMQKELMALKELLTITKSQGAFPSLPGGGKTVLKVPFQIHTLDIEQSALPDLKSIGIPRNAKKCVAYFTFIDCLDYLTSHKINVLQRLLFSK